MRDVFDIRIYLDPPEELRRKWKVARDTTKRGYTTDKVLSELDRREPDSAAFIRPQKQYADLVISFQPKEGRDQNELDAVITLHPGLPHPDLSLVSNGPPGGIELRQEGDRKIVRSLCTRRARLRARRGDRREYLGKAALRPAPALPEARRVHDRLRPQTFGVARRNPAPNFLPRPVRSCLRGARRSGHQGTREGCREARSLRAASYRIGFGRRRLRAGAGVNVW
ncbi:MAG: phosphoribulokinase [Rubrobacteraceae bacterium]|nr:phosphoribulokinase [Rubrobacteraceae bacterium]